MPPFTPGPETARAFRDALGRFATGVTIVTTRTESGPLGITANSFASVSLDPPLVLWSPARASRRFAAFESAKDFSIHILSESQHQMATAFTRDGWPLDGGWHDDDGAPVIEGCIARFDCTRHAIHDGGDHAIVVGRVRRAVLAEGSPLLFAGGAFGRFTDLT
jgi:flavin reductase (DIM6/NTAB) family NADH-FMN oxidoreductase RutF